MDSGSQRSYLAQRVQDALRLDPIDRQRLAIAAFGSKRAEPRLCDVVRVTVQTKVGDDKDVELFVVPHICEPLTEQQSARCLMPFTHLSGLELADDPREKTRGIDILIGSDFYWEFVTGEIRRGESGPIAINTSLGWVLSGPSTSVGPRDTTASLITVHTLRVDDGVSNKMLDATMKSFWELESLGIQSELTDSGVADQFAGSVQMKGGRYEVSLPWREGHDPLPTNYDLSRRRLSGLIRRLKQTPEILKEYDSIINAQLEQGIVEVVEEDATAPGAVHYLPHHAVVRQDKETTKVRVVYDASAKSCGNPSLNDCLHVGPKFNQRINELLFRFRSYPVALVADLEKAFLMISVNPCDRDVLRFLWVENPFSEEIKLKAMRFTRVVFGVSSSPFLLNATVRHHLEEYHSAKPDLIEILNHSTYVDDVVAGADSVEEALRFYTDAKEVFSYGSFNLRKFLSNSLEVQTQIDKKEATSATSLRKDTSLANIEPSYESYSDVTLSTDYVSHPGEHKVLGVRWDVSNDQLVFDLSNLADKAALLHPTKRNVVSVIGQIYDPLGYLSPVTVTFKILMQEVCKTKVPWDQPLVGEPLSKWKELIKALRRSKPLQLPRHYFDGRTTTEVQLYGFCDASNSAYAAVVYIAESPETQSSPQFVVSKTRVSPLKTQTIPRLKLLSALLLARLISNVVYSLRPRYEVQHVNCFTDSQVALCWIRGVDRDWKAFVQNRVEEIRRLVPPQLWSHCPGRDNPADIPSQGLDPTNLSLSQLWRHGPDWLSPSTEHRPSNLDNDVPEQCQQELKVGKPEAIHTLLASQDPEVGLVVDIERYSATPKLYRVTALVMKFIQLLRKQTVSTDLTQQDLTRAEELWIKESQKAAVQDAKFSMWQSQFGMFRDEQGLWRCGGRLQNSVLPYSAKHPILLSKNHYLSTLLIREAHRRVQHNGVRETLTELRSKFWIVGGRSRIRSIIRSCVVCRRYEGKPLQGPPQPPLPEFRVRESPPFTFTAVDFAGPLHIRGHTATSTSAKVWIALFTCCMTRAIHLELVLDMTTATFIRCVKRFAARRGLPRSFLSDNAKTFKGAAKSLKAICEHPDTRNHLSDCGIEWNFNLEKAPWWGGLFERLVKSTKRCLRKVVGTARFSFDEMNTAVVEIEAIVNSRPLSYVHVDDLETPLTPSHLLVGRRLLSLPDHLTYQDLDNDEDFELGTESLQRRAKHLSSILNHFWKRWSREYLLELRDAHRQRGPKNSDKPITVGDIVLVHNEDHPRGFWKMARVERLISGRDSAVRGAVLKVASKSGTATTLQRPLQRLYPLEISSNNPHEFERSSDKEGAITIAHSPKQSDQRRPQREAAVRGRKRVKEWCTKDLVDHS